MKRVISIVIAVLMCTLSQAIIPGEGEYEITCTVGPLVVCERTGDPVYTSITSNSAGDGWISLGASASASIRANPWWWSMSASYWLRRQVTYQIVWNDPNTTPPGGTIYILYSDGSITAGEASGSISKGYGRGDGSVDSNGDGSISIEGGSAGSAAGGYVSAWWNDVGEAWTYGYGSPEECWEESPYESEELHEYHAEHDGWYEVVWQHTIEIPVGSESASVSFQAEVFADAGAGGYNVDGGCDSSGWAGIGWALTVDEY